MCDCSTVSVIRAVKGSELLGYWDGEEGWEMRENAKTYCDFDRAFKEAKRIVKDGDLPENADDAAVFSVFPKE